MTERSINMQPLTPEAFAPFGEVIEAGTIEPKLINRGKCRRYSDLAKLDMIEGEVGISLFHADIRELPYELDLLERHPMGSQCFIPMEGCEYLVTVAEDDNGKPGTPVAFHAGKTQSVNIARNVWHGVLTPISGTGLFAVVDRIGVGANLEEFSLEKPFLIFR